MYPNAEKRFIRINRITIIVLFLVISAGGIVRSTGSGMGCPDWPKCFNRIIPPTDISQLPEGYEEHYVQGRVKKNIRFANVMEFLGFPEKANEIRHDESILQHEEFNAVKTWTEYVNRLVAVVSGVFLIALAFLSFTYRKKKVSITILSVLNLFVVMFQGWLGSIVVSTNLTPWVITVHMLLALLIVAISIYTYYLATTLRDGTILINHDHKSIKFLTVFSLIVLIIQIVMGTGVREEIDLLNYSNVDRGSWIESIGSSYTIHRILGYITMGLTVIILIAIKNRFNAMSIQSKYAWLLLALTFFQLVTGVILARLNVPAVAQTVHLITASVLFGTHYYLMLLITKLKRQ